MEFSTWIMKKYDEWRRGKVGHAASITKFAEQFGATHQIMGDWMAEKGKVPKSTKYINALVSVYGYEVYDVLGLPRPSVVEMDGVALLNASRELLREMKASGIDEDDPRYEILVKEIFGKFGIKVDSI